MLAFAKGHGTRNDFVLLTDPDNERPLAAADVRFLTDRRSGVGGDGVLRAVRARHVDGWAGDPDVWFMDYRNADGSIAEMCGNGVRVFARHLAEEGLVPHGTREIAIATRAGLRSAELLQDGGVRVWMGRPVLLPGDVRVTVEARTWPATGVDVGNPHAVVLVGAGELEGLDLSRSPVWAPADAFEQGVNVEFVDEVGPGLLRMRVFERGVGETESCGTGTVAAASAVMAAHGQSEGRWTVEVPGGRVVVDLRGGEAWLSGPAVIVARGSVELPGGGEA